MPSDLEMFVRTTSYDYDSADENIDDFDLVMKSILHNSRIKRVLAAKEKAHREVLEAETEKNGDLRRRVHALKGRALLVDGLVHLATFLTSMLVARTLAERRRP